jgi:hypothetical protein
VDETYVRVAGQWTYLDMVHREAALLRYFLQIPVAEGIPQVPADTQEDDSVLEVPPAE